MVSCWIFCAGVLVEGVVAQEVDFNRDIRPLLSDRCFACHGPDDEANESGLRLDTESLAKAELPSGDGFAIVAGNAQESKLLERIETRDPDLRMPPPESHIKINAAEVSLIKKWIVEGGNYSEHWAFVPPTKSSPPAISFPDFKHPIDRFVAATLSAQSLSPSPQADRFTLIRRLSFDLTGLPPDSSEVRRFVNDRRPDAYERFVDKLLASPHFGERMALDWLDAARYADTNGYSIDGGRHMWLWRDWVIAAFNSNKPYDEFLLEQIAGDLLPSATSSQKIASGFQRNNMVTHEGGTIPAENLTNYNADRVKTLGEAVLGLTLACAQCHDHKYDPITQEDYYGIFAYFNTLEDIGNDGDRGINPRPYVQAKTVLQTGEEEQLRSRIEELERELGQPDPAEFKQWEQQQSKELRNRDQGLQLHPLQVQKVSTPNSGAGFDVEDQRFVSITRPGWLAAYDVMARLPEIDEPVTGLRIVFHPGKKTPGNGLGFHKQKVGEVEKGNFALTALSISAGKVGADQVDLFRLLAPVRVTANSWRPDFRPENCLDMRNQNGWSPEIGYEGAVHLTVTFEQPLDARSTPFVTTQLNFGAGGQRVAARMELFAMTGHDDGTALPENIVKILQEPAENRSTIDQSVLQDHYSRYSSNTWRQRVDLENARERLQVLTGKFSTMVMNVAKKPRETYVLNRGDYSQPTVKVDMKTPRFLPRSSEKQDSRLALARWMTMAEHPLTARVYVNRVWQMMFGAGIVRTPADFGAQGQWPTHPQLLDWLAVDFVESGWDIKALVKKIVTSQTYRQSSRTDASLLEKDPDNRLLARGPRFRLPAEFVRDSALKTGGLLKPYLGGPSVNPYAPGDLWREVSHYGSTPATSQTFVQDHGDKLYRRSLYTYWKRTSPPPNMSAFDAPNRETCVVGRPVTNTPLQALVTLNDVQFVEAARAFAERIFNSGDNDTARIQWAIQEALSRPATALESTVLSKAVARERQHFHDQRTAADELLSVGESERDLSIPVHEHAAWTMVASTILNLSESVVRN